MSRFRDWEQLDHADKWLLFPKNTGPHLAIDESSLSDGELYTFVTNRDRHTRDESLVAVVSGTRSEDVIQVLKRMDEDALQESNDEMEECRLSGKPYVPFRFSYGDTRPELLVRSRYLLFKSADKWTENRKKERVSSSRNIQTSNLLTACRIH